MVWGAFAQWEVVGEHRHLVDVGKMLLCFVMDSIKPLTKLGTHQTLVPPLVCPLTSP